MTGFVVSIAGIVMIIVSLYNLSQPGTPFDVSIGAAKGYAKIDPIRFLIAAFFVSIPVLVLQQSDEQKAWGYIFLIVLVLLISQGNYRHLARFIDEIRSGVTFTSIPDRVVRK